MSPEEIRATLARLEAEAKQRWDDASDKFEGSLLHQDSVLLNHAHCFYLAMVEANEAIAKVLALAPAQPAPVNSSPPVVLEMNPPQHLLTPQETEVLRRVAQCGEKPSGAYIGYGDRVRARRLLTLGLIERVSRDSYRLTAVGRFVINPQPVRAA